MRSGLVRQLAPLLTAETTSRLVTMGGSRALAAGLGFLATVLIARSLEPAALGLWSLALAAQGLALHLSEAGLRSVATAEVARDPALARVYLRRTIGLRLAISSIVVGLGTAIAAMLQLGDWRLTALVLSSLWPIALQLDWLPLALGRQRLAAGLLLVRPLAFVALIAAIPLMDDPSVLAGCYLAAWWLASLLSWPCRRIAPPAAGGGLPTWSLVRLALPIAAVTAASQLVLSLDLLLVGARLGAAVAAQYYLASAVLVAGLVVVNGLGQSALVRMGARATNAAAFRTALAADLRLSAGLAVIGALTVATTGPILLPLAFGGSYAPAGTLLLWLLPWFMAQHLTTMLQAAMTSARQGDRLLRANLWMALALAVGLAMAWTSPSLAAFALARGLAEVVRVLALALSLPPALRPFAQKCPARIT